MKGKWTYFWIVVLFCLTTLRFYIPVMIPSDLLNLVYYLVFSSVIIFLLYRFINGNIRKYKSKFTFPILLLILSVLFSYISSFFFWEQGVLRSFLATIYVLSFILFFLLLTLDVDAIVVEKLIAFFGITYMVMYVIGLFTFPHEIFKIHYFGSDRGFPRIVPEGLGFLFLFNLFSINKFIDNRKPRWMILYILSMISIILTLTRALIVVSFIMNSLLIFRKSSLLKKITATIFIGLFVFIISQTSIFRTVVNKTIHEKENWQEDNRRGAFEYYLHEFSPNTFTRIFGNGMPDGHSPYGRFVVYVLEFRYGYYLSDIGYAGIYVTFGVFFLLGIMLLWIRVARTRVPDNLLYAKYFHHFAFFVSVINGVYVVPSYILSIALATYLLSVKEVNET